MNTAIEERIRTRAYELWESEGRPDGREIDHWLQAVHEVAADRGADGKTAAARAPRKAAASAATGPAPKAKSTKTAAAATPAAKRKVAPKSS